MVISRSITQMLSGLEEASRVWTSQKCDELTSTHVPFLEHALSNA